MLGRSIRYGVQIKININGSPLLPPSNTHPFHNPFHNLFHPSPRYPGGMPVPCGVGQYSLLGESYCRACPRGHACAVVDAAPVPCLNGTFSLGNATSCVDAPKGFYSAITTEQPIRCPRGYTATSAKSRLCTRCPAGYECPSADVSVYWFIRLLVYWFISRGIYTHALYIYSRSISTLTHYTVYSMFPCFRL